MFGIVYKETISTFINQSLDGNGSEPSITKEIEKGMRISGVGYSSGSDRSWTNSLPILAEVLKNGNVNRDADIAIEYLVSPTHLRIDALISGNNSEGRENLVIVELKQWGEAKRSELRNHVFTNGGGGERDYWHPSYQAANYAGILKNFNAYIQDNGVSIGPCSFLHNMPEEYTKVMRDLSLFPKIPDFPVFLKDDGEQLAQFIKTKVQLPNKELLFNIEQSPIRPSPKLVDMLNDAIHNCDFFSYSDDQAYAVSRIVQLVNESIEYGERKTIIVRGGPGTGKSIIAINVLGQILKNINSPNAAYMTQNKAPRDYYLKQLIEDDMDRATVKGIFKSPLSLARNGERYDCLLFDEAHRMYTWRGGTGLTRDVNLIKKAIESTQVGVFFIDEDQAVTVHDAATIDYIKKLSKECHRRVYDEIELKTQFRVLGGNDYLNMVNSLLGYPSSTAGPFFLGQYDFRVFDSANEMRNAIREMNSKYKKCRMVAGYDYEWVSLEPPDQPDIILDDGKFSAKWNLKAGMPSDYSWLYDDNSLEEVGCIHTCQGLDMEYCGVIIGPDFRFENGQIVFDPSKLAKTDKSSGIRTCKDRSLAERLIRNTYKVLLTRGMRGTFVYCEDSVLREHIRSMSIR